MTCAESQSYNREGHVQRMVRRPMSPRDWSTEDSQGSGETQERGIQERKGNGVER